MIWNKYLGIGFIIFFIMVLIILVDFSGCKHNWKLVDTQNVTHYEYSKPEQVNYYAFVKIYECSNCLKLKKTIIKF